MKDEREKWIESVFESMEGSQRAKPSPSLLSRIEDKIYASEANLISIPWIRWAVAAAVTLIVLNIAAVSYSAKQSNTAYSSQDTESGSLISDYQLYE